MGPSRHLISALFRALVVTALLGLWPRSAIAHPMIENALDVVIWPDKIVLDTRISMEEVLMTGAVQGATPPRDRWAPLAAEHGAYVLHHLRVRADGASIPGAVLPFKFPLADASTSTLIPYHLEYPLPAPPQRIEIVQNFLREFPSWSASCVVRVRQSDDPVFQMSSLTREQSLEYQCEWPAATTQAASTRPSTTQATSSGAPIRTQVKVGATILEYTQQGIRHILTGYDHLLFVSALVLAATKLWDLVKVVTAFTVAHTLTLVLSVNDIVTLSERIVEPMIAASIVFVAVQNLFWPRQSRGWTRLAIAFAFGLFHGLGYAGALKEPMRGMPPIALWTALGAFSLGVEIGHQAVVLPLYTALRLARNGNTEHPRSILSNRLLKFGSCAISVAGAYYLIQALR